MAGPIDVGAPRFSTKTTGASDTTFNSSVAKYSTALRAWVFDQTYPDVGEDETDLTVFFPAVVGPSPSLRAIHEVASFKSVDTLFVTGNLHILNPIGYKDKPITEVLRDLIVHQAHAGHGKLKVTLTGDGSTNQWTRSLGTNPFFTYVDEKAEAPDLGDYLEDTTAGHLAQFLLRDLPANGSRMHEVVVGVIGALRAGTDLGVTFQIKLYAAGAVQQGRTMHADMYTDNSPRRQVVKFENLDCPDTTWAGVYIEIATKRGFAGGAPNPRWRLYTLDVVGYYEVIDVVLVNMNSFIDLDAQYSAHTLDFDLISGTFRSAVLDVLKHAPELFLYMDWNGALACGRIGKYADAVSPLKLSTEDKSILGVTRGPYRYDERTGNSVNVKWSVIPNHISAEFALQDPTNDVPDRGARRHREASEIVLAASGQDARALDRQFIRKASVVDKHTKSYLNLYPKDITGVDLLCSLPAVEVEPGDVVEVTIPKLGYQDKKMLVVDNSFDLDRDLPILTVYDMEYTL